MLCQGKIAFCILSLVVWLGYTVCLLVQTVPLLQSFQEYINSPNATKDLRTQIPEITDVDYVLSWMKKTLALVYMPQYMLSIVYIVAMVSSLLDIVYKEWNRLQFITASCNSLSSLLYFLIVGATVFSIGLCFLFIQFIQHLAGTMKSIEKMSATVTPEVKELDSFNGTIHKASQWLSAQFFFVIMMFLLYSLSFCYWPHSLRMRNKKNRKLISNLEEDSNDDL